MGWRRKPVQLQEVVRKQAGRQAGPCDGEGHSHAVPADGLRPGERKGIAIQGGPEHQVTCDEADVVDVVRVPGGEVHKQVVDNHHHQHAEHGTSQQVFFGGSLIKGSRLPESQRSFHGASGGDPQYDLIAPGFQIQGHDKVLVLHHPLDKGLLVAQRIAGDDAAIHEVEQAHVVQKRAGEFDETRHRLAGLVVEREAEPISVVGKAEVGAGAGYRHPGLAIGHGLVDLQLTGVVLQVSDAGSDVGVRDILGIDGDNGERGRRATTLGACRPTQYKTQGQRPTHETQNHNEVAH